VTTLYILQEFGEEDIDMSFNKEYIEERKKILDYYSHLSFRKSTLSIRTFSEEDDNKRLAHYRRVMATTTKRPWEG